MPRFADTDLHDALARYLAHRGFRFPKGSEVWEVGATLREDMIRKMRYPASGNNSQDAYIERLDQATNLICYAWEPNLSQVGALRDVCL